jgi:predicted secreted protein
MAACTPPEELVGFGALLQYYNNLTSAWVTVGGSKDLEYPEDVTEEIETTANDTTDGYRTKIPSLLSSLETVSYTINYRWSQYSVLRGIKENRDILEWRVVLMNPEQTYNKFCAFISSLSAEIPMEELIQTTISLTPTGGPELGELV